MRTPGQSVSEPVRIVEVSPRDGLQNESTILPTATKLAFILRLIAAGCTRIEVTSFVNPKAVPALADAADVVAQLGVPEGVDLIALVPNERGLERAMAAGCRSIELFTAATDAFCQANIRCTIDESFGRFAPIMATASAAGLKVRGAVSVAFVCPFTGDVATEAVIAVAKRLSDIGCSEVAICDTTGKARHEQMVPMLEAIQRCLPLDQVALHMHDTTGQALDHIGLALDAGVRTFDAAVAGLGGCPFSPGAPGNVATESVLELMAARGLETGIDQRQIADTGRWIRDQLSGAPLASA